MTHDVTSPRSIAALRNGYSVTWSATGARRGRFRGFEIDCEPTQHDVVVDCFFDGMLLI